MGLVAAHLREYWRSHALIGVAVAALTSSADAYAQSDAATLSASAAFQVGYGMSFQLDQCGDKTLGRIFRKAILEKFDHCHFSHEVSAEFQAWVAETSTRVEATLEHQVVPYGTPFIRLDGMKQTCQEMQESEQYKILGRVLGDYASGKVSVDTVITDRCNVSVGGP